LLAICKNIEAASHQIQPKPSKPKLQALELQRQKSWITRCTHNHAIRSIFNQWAYIYCGTPSLTNEHANLEDLATNKKARQPILPTTRTSSKLELDNIGHYQC